MPLAEFVAPIITRQYLDGLSIDQLTDLLLHKTNGFLAASRLHLNHTGLGKQLQEEIQKIQKAITERGRPL